MRDEALERRALELIRELSVVHAAHAGPGSRLGDVGFDSLGFAELAAAVEEEFGLDVGDPELDASSTVADLVAVLERASPATAEADVPQGTGRLQRTADVLGGWALRWWLDLEVEGAERVPPDGPAVLAMNHESALDIPIAVVASPRPITFMAKTELYKNAFASWSVHELGGFRVDRDRFDIGAVRIGLAVLGRREVLGMYPEGTRSPGELLPFLRGAAWLALRSGAPLLPLSLDGTERARQAKRPRRVQVRARFGHAIETEPVQGPAARRRRAEELTDELRRRIQAGLEAER